MSDYPNWTELAAPFPDDVVKQRPGAAKWDHKPNCEGTRCRETRDETKHHQFSYIDARVVAQRLDEVLTPGNWQFTCSVIPGSDIVKGTLSIAIDLSHAVVREDHGYPNSDRDEEPIKAATSDALKRCAVLFGIGRHLYDDNRPGAPVRPQNGHSAPRPVAAPPRSSTHVPESVNDLDWDNLSPVKPGAVAVAERAEGTMWSKELFDRAETAGIEKRQISDTAKKMFGRDKWKVTELSDGERFALAVELGLV